MLYSEFSMVFSVHVQKKMRSSADLSMEQRIENKKCARPTII